MTIEQLLNELEKSENANQIKHLANFKDVDQVENVKEVGGLTGLLAKSALRFTQKHTDAFITLSKCKNTADIAKFKKTAQYDKIKNSTVEAEFLNKH